MAATDGYVLGYVNGQPVFYTRSDFLNYYQNGPLDYNRMASTSDNYTYNKPLYLDAGSYLASVGNFVDPVAAPVLQFTISNASNIGSGIYSIGDLASFYQSVAPNPASNPQGFSYSSYALSNNNIMNFSLSDNMLNSQIFGSTAFKVIDGSVAINPDGSGYAFVQIKPYNDQLDFLTNHSNGSDIANAVINGYNSIFGPLYGGNNTIVPLNFVGEGAYYEISFGANGSHTSDRTMTLPQISGDLSQSNVVPSDNGANFQLPLLAQGATPLPPIDVAAADPQYWQTTIPQIVAEDAANIATWTDQINAYLADYRVANPAETGAGDLVDPTLNSLSPGQRDYLALYEGGTGNGLPIDASQLNLGTGGQNLVMDALYAGDSATGQPSDQGLPNSGPAGQSLEITALNDAAQTGDQAAIATLDFYDAAAPTVAIAGALQTSDIWAPQIQTIEAENQTGVVGATNAVNGDDQNAAASLSLEEPAGASLAPEFGVPQSPTDSGAGSPLGLGDQARSPMANVFAGGGTGIGGGGTGIGIGGTGSFFGGFGGSGYPVVLDLAGTGIKVTPLSSSNMFVDMANNGFVQRTAWAGAGEGVLVYDPSGGPITQANQFEFTLWDPSATSDMQASANAKRASRGAVRAESSRARRKTRSVLPNAAALRAASSRGRDRRYRETAARCFPR